jgi:hypothetical protein
MRVLSSKIVSRIRKKIFYYQFCMGTPEGHQKSIFSISEGEKTQKFIWTEFAGSTQNPYKIIKTPNLPNEMKIFPKKVCLVP